MATNQAVGSSNLSGRAIFIWDIKKLRRCLAACSFASFQIVPKIVLIGTGYLASVCYCCVV